MLGFSVWIDEAKIKLGEEFKKEIRRAITKADHMLVLVSQASNASPWVRFEIDSAIIKEHTEDREIILPVLLDQIALPEGLESRTYVDLSSEEHYRANLRRLAERLGNFGDVQALSPRALPEGISVEQSQQSLVITRAWKDVRLLLPQFRIVAYVFLALVLAQVYFGAAAVRLADPIDYLALALLTALVLLLLHSIYDLATTFINRQVIELSPTRLVIRNGPLPSKLNLSCEIPAALIASIECVEEKHHLSRHTIVHYVLWAISSDGDKIQLPSGPCIYSAEQGVFLRETLQTHLDLARTMAKGDVFTESVGAVVRAFDHATFTGAISRDQRSPADPRESVWLGNWAHIARRFALGRFKVGMLLGLAAALTGVALHWRNDTATLGIAVSCMLTACALGTNDRRILRLCAIVLSGLGPLLMYVTWREDGWGHVAIVGGVTAVCLKICSTLWKMPARFLCPIAAQGVWDERAVFPNSDEDLPVDVWISRPQAGGGREKLFLTSGGELVRRLREWRDGADPADIRLTWGSTRSEVASRVRESIEEHVGLRYLLDEERERAWKGAFREG